MDDAYEVIIESTEPTDIPFLFALNLNPGPNSRVKVYFEHPNGMAVDIAAKLAAICPETNPKEVERFLVTMSGGSPGPYRGQPARTCIAFKMGEDGSLKTPQETMYFPISEYNPHDQERSINVLKKRLLEAGGDLHSWVAFKTTKMRGKVFTF
ncbi:hypothetical protein DL764_010877 [Monosporascus ibericus]|uniref:Uncharacterized protein n=1 Tax=Monosporascus ibericus TaxID=155417 RepID=A0A4Q4SS13_9PEZI|nr:hypothetical protein DL764_010877 [Monosporascus ibericus]